MKCVLSPVAFTKEHVDAFQKMADHTLSKCGQPTCRSLSPTRCCSPEYCLMAKEYAAENGITLVPTGHAELPFMGEKGCVVAPHLRPLCSLHHCAINNLGILPKDPEWTKKYFQLRARIDDVS